jgi:Spy/CpxP family protein refolding chaperone
MKTLKTNFRWMLILILSGILSTGLFAQPGQGRTMERPYHPMHNPPPPGLAHDSLRKMHRNGMLKDIPGLTDEQMARIKKSRLELMKAATPLKKVIMEQKAHMETILATQPVDMKAAEQVADDMAKNKAALMKLAIRHDQEIRGFLTPDQQIIFDTKPKPFLGKGKRK